MCEYTTGLPNVISGIEKGQTWLKRTWIGLERAQAEQDWLKWIDGTPLDYEYWAEDGPHMAQGRSTYCINVSASFPIPMFKPV
ncbi:unnamed protein product [Strongylus vulgaris]|uniref:C-type lectin domain-containing protein n=1 Tax=Strongylus vulgaris TaxID=40348 RepID=A0A3P7JPG8_STRVU|nr:unnamed protein product [Strongylus vulgaris]